MMVVVTAVALLVVATVLVCAFHWSIETGAVINQGILEVYFEKPSTKGDITRIYSLADCEDMDFDVYPTHGNHRFNTATGGWSRIHYTTYHKGLTLRSYRVGQHLKKCIKHPCTCGYTYKLD